MPKTTPSPAPVLRRRVFYIPGFDPAPPRRYRELYRKEAQRQAAISGYAIDLGARHGTGSFGWSVTGIIDGHEVRAEFDVQVWSDIVRASMGGGVVSTYWQLLRTAWIYISTGALFRLGRLRKGPVIAALYPIAVLLAELAFAVLAGVGLSILAGLVLPAVVGWTFGTVAVVLILQAFQRIDGKIFAYYLMHDYAFTAQRNGAYPLELEARLAIFRGVITEALQGGCDEVLVVGHSSGAHLAVSILADILREEAAKVPLGFLSLGQVVPMVSFLPEAHRLRADLHFLSTQAGFAWVDVTAPGDGCSFALCDPVAVSGVAGDGKLWPLVISAAFTQTLSPARWKALRWRFFRLHFQYLCAFDQPGEYDYFQITAGPQTLASRFSGRAASKSRIETPTSAYTSRAA